MTKPMIKIHDAENDTIIEREMNDIELAEYEKNQEVAEKTAKEFELAKSNKQLILDRLGITQDEAKLLLG